MPRSLKGGGDLTLRFDGGHCFELLNGMARMGAMVVVVCIAIPSRVRCGCGFSALSCHLICPLALLASLSVLSFLALSFLARPKQRGGALCLRLKPV